MGSPRPEEGGGDACSVDPKPVGAGAVVAGSIMRDGAGGSMGLWTGSVPAGPDESDIRV